MTFIKIFFVITFIFIYLIKLNAWGFEAHKEINRRAIIFLPNDLIIFYKNYRQYIVEHAIDADKRKHFQKNEGAKHYINTDLCDVYPFVNVPKDYKKALVKYGKDSLQKIGVLPWNIESMCKQLTKAMQDKNGDQVLKISANLGHYIADASVPLHVTKNYNGQLTQQEGLHALWETQAVKTLNIDTVWIKIKDVELITNINKKIWDFILHSYTCIDEVLRTEKQISNIIGEDKKYHLKVKKNKTIKTYTDEFVECYAALNSRIIKQRIADASYLLASLYYTCWHNANKPDIKNMAVKHTKMQAQIIDEEANGLHH